MGRVFRWVILGLHDLVWISYCSTLAGFRVLVFLPINDSYWGSGSWVYLGYHSIL